jgi:polo-like kinase 1
MGYMLSTGAVGVYFNDSTKIVLDPGAGERFEYSERVSSGGSSGAGVGIAGAPTAVAPDGTQRVLGTLTTHAPELKKKATLLRHFREHLVAQYERRARGGADAALPATTFGTAAASAGGGLAMVTVSVPVSDEEASAVAAGTRAVRPAVAGALPLVKKWVRSRRAVLFRLSGGAGVQVSFYDGVSLVFEPRGSHVTLFNASGQRSAFAVGPLLDAAAAAVARPSSVAAALSATGFGVLAELEDVAARLRYARDIITQVIAGQSAAGGVGASPAKAS